MRLTRNVVLMPASVKTALPDAARALELAWRRRRHELARWQPSGGWLVEPRLPGVNSPDAPIVARSGS